MLHDSSISAVEASCDYWVLKYVDVLAPFRTRTYSAPSSKPLFRTCGFSYVFTAAKLIAPVMDKKDWESGYDWVVETIKLDHEYLASKMEVEKALHYLKTKEFDKVATIFC